MNYDYSFYLFVQLRMVIMPNDLEYDLQYSIDREMYDDFVASTFDDENRGEYECIAEFLNYVKKESK